MKNEINNETSLKETNPPISIYHVTCHESLKIKKNSWQIHDTWLLSCGLGYCVCFLLAYIFQGLKQAYTKMETMKLSIYNSMNEWMF